MFATTEYKLDIAIGPHLIFQGARFTCTLECMDGGGFDEIHFDGADSVIFHAQGSCMNLGAVDCDSLVRNFDEDRLDDLLDRASDLISSGRQTPVNVDYF